MTEKDFTRKLSAILSADVQGYSRLMDDDEESTIRTLTEYRKVMHNLIQQYRGRVVDVVGDNLLADFKSAMDAASCAIKIQRELSEKNKQLPDKRKMSFRIGVNVGEVIEEAGHIVGDGVNIAAQVESLSEPGGVCISGSTYDQIENKLDLKFKYLGKHQIKDKRRPIHIYQIPIAKAVKADHSLRDVSALKIPDKPSIAVLPFTNMSSDSEQKYFSDGITEDIITALSRSPWLFVISRNSSFVYRGTTVRIEQVSRELGVRYILEGSVRKSGNRVRVTAQLIDGTLGSHVWAEKYDGEIENIFDFQDQLTQKVTASILTQIQTNIGINPKRLDRPDVQTWDLLARGWKLFYELNKQSLIEAEALLRRAIESAPKSCDAHHLLAGVLIHQVWMGHTSEKDAVISEAFELAKKAIVIDDFNEYAHWSMGVIQFVRGKHDLSIAEFERAVELNPNCSLAYGSLGTVLSFSGKPDESIKSNEIAIRSNPKDASIFFRFSGIATAHFVAGRYLDAIEWAHKTIHRKPEWHLAHAILAASLAQMNRLEEAKEAVDSLLVIFPDSTVSSFRKLSFKNQDDTRRFIEGLRLAGLPE